MSEDSLPEQADPRSGPPKGGEFLVQAVLPDQMFTPEDFTPEQHQFARTAREFIRNDVLPFSDRIEAKDVAFTRDLMLQAGELGLLMADVPEEYGGLALDKASSALVYESMCGQTSFQTQCGVHSSIGSLPIVYYGSPEQKQKYLPRLATGELVGCYCLTEPTAGSDALACRAKAVLSADGTHYVLNGTKQFITNGGIADIFTVFAKIDGRDFTAFIVERGTPGLSTGPEEHKMGIRGSSTTTVILDDARVPAENVLGTIGEGHKIAFNILNFGRLKLGVQATGYCKLAIEESLTYCLDRKQFGRRLADFGAMREKLAEMFIRTYAVESATYRTVGHIEAEIHASGRADGQTILDAGEEYRIECALVKVMGTEILDYTVDEALQCFGGYGYSEEYAVERFYRDSRINRIYEGTNEINRIFAASNLLRAAAEGQLQVLQAAEPTEESGPLVAELGVIAALKRLCLASTAAVLSKYGKGAVREQTVLTRIADLAMQTYFAESAAVRARKDAAVRGAEAAALPIAAAVVQCESAAVRAELASREILAAVAADEGANELVTALERLCGRERPDTLALREQIAARLVEMERIVL